jgi:hypothetical protein
MSIPSGKYLNVKDNRITVLSSMFTEFNRTINFKTNKKSKQMMPRKPSCYKMFDLRAQIILGFTLDHPHFVQVFMLIRNDNLELGFRVHSPSGF